MNDSKPVKKKKQMPYDAAYHAAYRAAHKEERSAYDKAYHASHRRERSAYGKAYRASHKKEKKTYMKDYYASHREESKAYQKAYYTTRPFSRLTHQTANRHRKRGLSHLPTPSPEVLETIWKTGGEKCALCGVNIELRHPGGRTHPNAAQLDCVIPSKGYVEGNMTFLCAPCNRMKDKHTAETATRLAAFLLNWENQLG